MSIRPEKEIIKKLENAEELLKEIPMDTFEWKDLNHDIRILKWVLDD